MSGNLRPILIILLSSVYNILLCVTIYYHVMLLYLSQVSFYLKKKARKEKEVQAVQKIYTGSCHDVPHTGVCKQYACDTAYN